MATLNPGTHKIVITREVNDRIAIDNKFAEFVWQSLLRFIKADWGDVGKADWKANDNDLKSLNNGSWYGRILASYKDIWITRNTAEEDGTQAITVLFPHEY